MCVILNLQRETVPMHALKQSPMIFAVMIAATAVFGSNSLWGEEPDRPRAENSRNGPIELLRVEPTGETAEIVVTADSLSDEAPAYLVVTDPAVIEGKANVNGVLYADGLRPRPVPVAVAHARESRSTPSSDSTRSRVTARDVQLAFSQGERQLVHLRLNGPEPVPD